MQQCHLKLSEWSTGIKMASFRHSSVVSRRICISDVLLSILVSSRCRVSDRRPRGTAVRSSRLKFRFCDSVQSFRTSAMSVSVPSLNSFCRINSIRCTDLSLSTSTQSFGRVDSMTSFCLLYEVGTFALLLFLSFYTFGNYALYKIATRYSFC